MDLYDAIINMTNSLPGKEYVNKSLEPVVIVTPAIDLCEIIAAEQKVDV